MLVDGYGGTIVLAQADQIALVAVVYALADLGTARMSLYMAGRYSDGWLAASAGSTSGPSAPAGRSSASLTLTAPPGAEG